MGSREMSLVVALSLAAFGQTTHAEINVATARISNGQVVVVGNRAPSSTAVVWQGQPTGATTTPNGSFRFSTTNRPASCVGALTIGPETRDVVISDCQPAAVSSGVFRTGQTVSLYPGDDGERQLGTAWPSPRFVSNGDGSVTDQLTRLVWLADWTCLGPHFWRTALDTVATLGSGSCGLSDGSVPGDWRVPNRNEMLSVYDAGRFSPAFPVDHPFVVDLDRNWYWTSTSVAGGSPWIYDVDMGDLNQTGEYAFELLVTAVRRAR